MTKSADITAFNEESAQGYREKFQSVGDPFSCIVSVHDSEPQGDFTMLEISDEKQTAVFTYDDGSYGYRTLTHMLRGDGSHSFGLACDGNGNVEAYKIVGEEEGAFVTEHIAKRELGRRVVDPMFAFSSGQYLYLLFNLPTREAVFAGAKLRKPVASEDDALVMANGTPLAFKFDTVRGKVTRVLPRMAQTPTYVAALIDDPEGDVPALLLANVLIEEERDDPGSKPSFRTFFKRFLSDEDERKVERVPMPIGISAAHLAEDRPLVSIPQTGSVEFGIDYVSINALPDGENSSIRLIEEDIDDATLAACEEETGDCA